MPRSDPKTTAPHAERWEFVDAFVEHTRSSPGVDRLAARPHVALLVAVLVSACVAVAGLIMGLLNVGGRSGTGSTGAQSGFTAVAGWECPGTDNNRFEAFGRTRQWDVVDSGGWTSDNCRGSYASMPVTGSAAAKARASVPTAGTAPAEGALWSFRPGPKANRCAVAVYRPQTDERQVEPAGTAMFHVLAGRTDSVTGTFVFEQAKALVGWAEVGSFPVRDGVLVIRLAAQSVPAKTSTGRADAGDRLLLGQIRVTCGQTTR